MFTIHRYCPYKTSGNYKQAYGLETLNIEGEFWLACSQPMKFKTRQDAADYAQEAGFNRLDCYIMGPRGGKYPITGGRY